MVSLPETKYLPPPSHSPSSSLPPPSPPLQLITLVVLNPNNGTTGVESWQVVVRMAVLLQFIPRSCRVYPVITGTGGYTNVFDTPWMSFVLNIFTFFLGSQVVGAMWYLMSTQVGP